MGVKAAISLSRLPHARGGVSLSSAIRRGCQRVFPTHVGVFPSNRGVFGSACCLPHARGVFRIAGYLVGTVERFNDAKQAEVMDQVKHTV